MEFVEKCAKRIMGLHQGQKKTTIDAVFLLVYALFTCFLIIGLTTNVYYWMGADDSEHAVLNYILYMGSLCIIHIWIYMAVKFAKESENVVDYFEFDNKQKNDYSGSEQPENEDYKSFKDIWDNTKRWMTPFPIKVKSFFEFLVKSLYTLVWLGIFLLAIKFMSELGFYPFDRICVEFADGITIKNCASILGFILVAVGMFLNYFGYFMCIIFTYFLREVANSAHLLKFNHEKPSNTKGFHKLVHASSRVAIAFFFDSMIYVLMLAFDFVVAREIAPDKQVYVGISIACIFIPCIVSFLIVFILPKVFLSRLLREWKWLAVDMIEKKSESRDMLKEVSCGTVESEKVLQYDKEKNKSLEVIYNDEVPLVKTEVIVASVAVFVDIVSIVLSTMLFMKQ